MLWKLSVVVAIFILAPIYSSAQSTLTLCNDFVEADVSASSGLVTVFVPCGQHNTVITHPAETSYLTVLINNDSFFTNNPHLPLHGAGNTPPNTPAGYLQNGTTKFTGPNKDTIETVWEPQGPNAYKIIQDIFLAEFPIVGSGQVIYKFSIENLQNSALTAQAQYLIDVDLGTGVTDNDAAPITTRFGYLSTQPVSFPNVNDPFIPPYFIATLEPLSSADFPTLLAEGYCNDSLAPEPMGLMQPSLFAFVAWQDVVQTQTWGAPTFTQSINDDALLFQWLPQASDSGQTQLIGSFSYGSAACSPICFGNLDAIMLHPEHIVWNGSKYVPNHFPVDAVVWNQNDTIASVASGTQNITNATTGMSDGPIKIASPLPDSNNGYRQTHNLSNAGTIPAQQSSSITWEDTVLDSVLINCSTDSIYNIAFSVSARGVGSTACQNGTYICPVEVDCEETSSVSEYTLPSFTLSIYPNPTSGDVNILINGAPSADVEIFDVLGREVDHFLMNESYDWQTAALPSGTYIVRAVVNGASDVQTITKRIVKE